jgi:Beta-propeller repeat
MLTWIVASPVNGQVRQAWVAHYNNGITNSTNQAVRMALDSDENVIVTGFSQNTNNQLGYVTIKYAPNGNQLWATRFDSTNYPMATPAAMAVDNSNNVIATGNALTIKYDANGNQLWTAPYSGVALAVDTNGNVVTTGIGTIFGMIKLNAAGATLWQTSYPSSCGSAAGQAVVGDSSGNIYLAGSYPFFCNDGLVDYELLILKYSASGTQVWATSDQDAGRQWQTANVVVDGAGNLYLAGNFTEDSTYSAFAYDASGNQTWAGEPFFNVNDLCYSMAIDQKGCVLMTGRVLGNSSFLYGTAKLGTNGSTLWASDYPPNGVGPSVANAVAVDYTNNSYVTGYSPGSNGTNNIVTIKYGPSGNQIWLQSYNGLNNGNDVGNAIAVDKNGNVYVTGYETLPGGGTGIVTIKYIPISIQRQTNGTVMIQVSGSPGEMFDIEASTNLQTWLDLGTVTADTNGLMQFDDTNASNYPARFYYTNPQ